MYVCMYEGDQYYIFCMYVCIYVCGYIGGMAISLCMYVCMCIYNMHLFTVLLHVCIYA